ncbi:nuclear transport factor 2 family protein [Sphingobium sufflavum]|uniref:nuclear transport factor 2 family protein n=1 Tax=Sphingobium sufflavum TaxID=1129547 RepID=UPI001F22D121|nr:nuclear transport factor 2 family protein [Sphingobium sufflavum]MCE7798602.1 nuclear transport factor 2 family protein [Sphingobium sufflavum]
MSIEQRLEQLEQRLRAAEDHLEILNLLNSYGPLVDSGTSEPAAALWIEGGGYNFSGGLSGGTRIVAPQDLVAMYETEGHKGLVDTGCSHLTATPRIAIDGDSAEAVGYSYVVLKEGDRWYLWRAAINRWSLTRTADGWRIQERFNRALDGSAESHETMRHVLGPQVPA